MKYLFFLLAMSYGAAFFGQAQSQLDSGSSQTGWVEMEDNSIDVSVYRPKTKRKPKRSKIRKSVAILLAIALGPFGVHRLYLGTSELTPLFYSLTLGGLMILPLIDIFCILFTKDLEKYKNNDRVIMW